MTVLPPLYLLFVALTDKVRTRIQKCAAGAPLCHCSRSASGLLLSQALADPGAFPPVSMLVAKCFWCPAMSTPASDLCSFCLECPPLLPVRQTPPIPPCLQTPLLPRWCVLPLPLNSISLSLMCSFLFVFCNHFCSCLLLNKDQAAFWIGSVSSPCSLNSCS